MNPVEIHERLDNMGLLNESHQSGCYALAVPVPDSVEAVQRARLAVAAHPFDDTDAAALADAATVEYIGGSGDVYDRLEDHARGEVRKASLLNVFGFEDVTAVRPADEPFRAERALAYERSTATRAVWTNGEVL